MRGALRILLAAASLSLWTPAAWSQQVPFVVEGVGVDVTAEDANAAREIALASGMEEALGRLLRRITPREHHERLPRPVPDDVSALVAGLEVQDERTSTTRYLARLTVRFSRAGVRALLRRNGIPFTEAVSAPRLVLPLYRVAGAQILWDEPNPWREAWRTAQEGRESVTPLVLPQGDLADVALIGAAQAARRDEARLDAIAGRYGVRDSLVAEAALRFEIGSRTPAVEAMVTSHGPGGERTTVADYRGGPDESVAALLSRAALDLAGRIEEQWKQDTLIRFEEEGEIVVTVVLTRAGDWAEIRGRLEAMAEVKTVLLSEISRSHAAVAVGYFGDLDRLVLALRHRDLDLRESAGGWTLRLGTGGAR